MRTSVIIGAILLSVTTASAQHAPQAPKEWIDDARNQWSQVTSDEKACIKRNLPWWSQQKTITDYINAGIGPNFIDINVARRDGHCFQGYKMTTNPNTKVESPDMPVIGYKAAPDQPNFNKMSEEDRDTLETELWVILGLAVGLYMLPGLIAILRGHPSWGAIFVFNLLLGWTFMFWVVALTWACSATRKHIYHDNAEFLKKFNE